MTDQLSAHRLQATAAPGSPRFTARLAPTTSYRAERLTHCPGGTARNGSAARVCSCRRPRWMAPPKALPARSSRRPQPPRPRHRSSPCDRTDGGRDSAHGHSARGLITRTALLSDIALLGALQSWRGPGTSLDESTRSSASAAGGATCCQVLSYVHMNCTSNSNRRSPARRSANGSVATSP